MTEPFFIETLDQLKALADPLRQRILTALCCGPATTRQIAKQLGAKPTRLYHHIDLLEDAGLIKLVDTRQKRGATERYYQTTASQFVVDQALLHVAEAGSDIQPDMQAMLVDALQTGLAEVRDAYDADRQLAAPNTTLLCCAHLRLTTEQAQALVAQMRGWLDACCGVSPAEAGDSPAEDDQASYALTIAFFPVQDKG